MKTVNLSAYGVEEMSELHMNRVNGGGIALAIAIATVCVYAYNNADDFVEGFNAGWNKK